MQTSAKALHVAVIMDGNGRWAKKRGLPRVFGHREGVVAVKRIVKYAKKQDIGYLSMFAFSAENWLRPADEISFLMGLLYNFAESEAEEICNNNIRFVMSGRLEKIPSKTMGILEKLATDTKNNTGMVLNLVLSYGARDEICDAAKSAAADILTGAIKPDDVTTDYFRTKLYNPEIPDVDLMIRTGGEQRVSNFLLWQSAYAELHFTETLWPDFSESDFDVALGDFAKRTRRFGKTDEQIENLR